MSSTKYMCILYLMQNIYFSFNFKIDFKKTLSPPEKYSIYIIISWWWWQKRRCSYRDSNLWKLLEKHWHVHTPNHFFCVSTKWRKKVSNVTYFAKHHPVKKGYRKSTGEIMEPFANVFVRETHLSVKNMQFSMQLHRTSFQIMWISLSLVNDLSVTIFSSQFGNVLTNRLNSS